MSIETGRPTVGTVGWHDLTVSNAAEVADFYSAVVGWTPHAVDRGDYADYGMASAEDDREQAGVCWARGPNTGLPPQWLMYVVVADLEASLQACLDRGGEVVQRQSLGMRGRHAVIRDPAGAVCALWQPEDPEL